LSHEPKADWFSVSTRLLRDRKVQALVRKHGHEVSSAVIALFAQARLQKKAGEVDISWYDLAHDALTTEDKAKAIVEAANERGFLVIDEQDEDGVVLHFPAWKRHQNTASQQRSREARKATPEANVIDGHHLSSNVVLQDKTGEDKTEHKKKAAPADSLPKDFPPDLVATVDSVRPLLQSIADARGAKTVTRLALAKVIQQYPHHAHLKVANKLDHWLLHGDGEKKPCKDVVARYRFFLDGDKPVAVSRPTVQQSTVERMAEALPEIPKEQIDMHIYRLGQLKRPVTPESIRERHEATKKVAA